MFTFILILLGIVAFGCVFNIGTAIFVGLGVFLMWINHPEEEENTLPKT